MYAYKSKETLQREKLHKKIGKNLKKRASKEQAVTPARTHFISGLKSRVLKLTFLT